VTTAVLEPVALRLGWSSGKVLLAVTIGSPFAHFVVRRVP
jgi:hypothetical protein